MSRGPFTRNEHQREVFALSTIARFALSPICTICTQLDCSQIDFSTQRQVLQFHPKSGFCVVDCVANEIYRFPICWANADIRPPFPKVNGVVLDIFLHIFSFHIKLVVCRGGATFLILVSIFQSGKLIDL